MYLTWQDFARFAGSARGDDGEYLYTIGDTLAAAFAVEQAANGALGDLDPLRISQLFTAARNGGA